MKKEKQLFLVKDLARMCEMSTDAIRYYTRRGLLNPVRDPVNQYNLYNKRDVQKLNFIARAKYLGYSLGDIEKIFRDCEKGKSPCPRVRHIIEQRISENRKRLEKMVSLQRRMENALAQWEKMPDGIPDGDKICALIDSFDDS